MKGSEFVSVFRGKPYTTWENAAVDMARRGEHVAWPMLPLITTNGGRTCRVRVACDYFSVGTPDDYLRMPLTPAPAQRVADLFGYLLPTKKLSIEIWRQSKTKIGPLPIVPNKGADLDQYVAINKLIESQLSSTSRRGIVGGHKKDIVVGRLVRPGKVVIVGWYWADDPIIHGPYMTANMRASQPVQPYSDAHGDSYVDYSHGVRLVEGVCEVDGVQHRTVDVLADPLLAGLLSDEEPILSSQVRYPTGAPPSIAMLPYDLTPTVRTDPADRGLDIARERVLEREEKPRS